MRKNIGILFPDSRKMGVFQYSMSIAEGLINFCLDFDYTILYFGNSSPKEFLKVKGFENVKFISVDGSANSFWGKVKMALNILLKKPFFVANKKNKEILDKAKIDLLIIPFPLLFGFENRVPCVVSIPDIMHKYYPSFPEYKFYTRLKRDFVYKISSENALISIVDSDQGKKDLNKFYGIAEDKIEAISYIPPGYIFELKNMPEEKSQKLLAGFNLPEKFLFYPAQFWFHKNHLRLLKAIKILRDEKKQIVNLVLSGNPGANNENYAKIIEFVSQTNLENQIFRLGYVSDEQMVALYKKSYALVFPTLIGPTSIPPFEAMVLGTPVLCSGLFSMPDQVGSAGLLFNPFSEKDMAEKIYKFWIDENLRNNFAKNAQKMGEKVTREGFTNEWKNAINKALCKKEPKL